MPVYRDTFLSLVLRAAGLACAAALFWGPCLRSHALSPFSEHGQTLLTGLVAVLLLVLATGTQTVRHADRFASYPAWGIFSGLARWAVILAAVAAAGIGLAASRYALPVIETMRLCALVFAGGLLLGLCVHALRLLFPRA